MSIEKTVIKSDISQSNRGQWLGFIVALLFWIAAFILSLKGHEVVAGILGGTTIVGLVTVFVTGKKIQKKELEQKDQEAQEE